VPAEFVFARMMYGESGGGGFGRRGFRDWRQGGGWWTNDYPRADRHLLMHVRRLTRVDARSVEQPVNLEDGDDVYNWPFLYVVRPSYAVLSDEQVARLRDYLARGGLGFFLGDGRLNYRTEQIFETYYSMKAAKNVWFTLDYQHVQNPAYNADRGPANFFGLRLHLEM